MDLEQVKDLLPEPIQQIVLLIGYPETSNLVKKLGGVTFPIGKAKRESGKLRLNLLIETVGEANAQKIIAHFGGEDLYIARCDNALKEYRNRQFIAEFDNLRQNNISALLALTELCPKYGFSDRQAWKLLERYQRTASSQQESLF